MNLFRFTKQNWHKKLINIIFIGLYLYSVYYSYTNYRNDLLSMLSGFIGFPIILIIFYLIARVFAGTIKLFFESIFDMFEWIFRKISPSSKLNTRNIEYHTTPDSYSQAYEQACLTGSINDIHISDIEKGQGAFMVLNSTLLKENERNIKDGIVKRNNDERYKAYVQGFRSVKNDYYLKNDRKEYIYHRTHLLPFRFCLSDGDIRNIMFTGTSHLNSGDRPKFNYYVKEFNNKEYESPDNKHHGYYGGLEYRQYLLNNHRLGKDSLTFDYGNDTRHNLNPSGFGLKERFVTETTHYKQVTEDKYSLENLHSYESVSPYELSEEGQKQIAFEKSCHMSLNDFEIACSNFIKARDRKKTYVYSVKCIYENNTNVPTKVYTCLTEVKSKRVILDIFLSNTH